MGDALDASPQGYYVCSFDSGPVPIYCAWEEYSGSSSTAAAPNSNFLKGVKWSPDGSCCLTVTDDNWLRVFDLPQDALHHQPAAAAAGQPAAAAHAAAGIVNPAAAGAAAAAAVGTPWYSGLQVHAGETVYDYAWFPGMSTADPVSCCFASTSRGQPIKLWDACSGQLRASYRAYDDADEITAAASVTCSPDGSKLLAGYNKALRAFDVARPGRECRKIATYRKRQEGSMAGIISCLCFSPVSNDLLAAGSYSRCIGLFDGRTYEQLLLLEGHKGGVTQVSFSPDGNFLYTGARQDDQIHCWDIRATGQVLYSMSRCTSSTNQRIAFSIEPCGRHLATGGCDGAVRVFDLCDGRQVASFQAAADTVNGVDFSPCLGLLATASGHRRFALLPADGWEAEDAAAGKTQQQQQQQQQQSASDGDITGLSMASWQPGGLCNSLRLWRCEAAWVAAAAAAEGDAGAAGDAAEGMDVDAAAAAAAVGDVG
ncbi:hypothetical protein OEZ85_009412 [Tetradesmus obliquus]|uniref:Anaphase-promoting complex subunit 4 WD40 domain-containing protein n=1 Tax=Tetradesmus obliquus TaxID=3088 RepID=A0ABY8UBB1_TETOB|nr:hypothetical protein OEZ85_009412 [Tetradesmus obliquus]